MFTVKEKVNKCIHYSIQRDGTWTLPIYSSLKEMRNIIIHGSRIMIDSCPIIINTQKCFAHIAAMGFVKNIMGKKILENTS